jgi:hypothetical protein
LHKRKSGIFYFPLAYAWAHAIDIDKVQDAFGDGVNGDGAEFVRNGDREGVECNGSAAAVVAFGGR